MPEKPLIDLVSPSRKVCYGIVQPGKPVSAGVPVLRVNNFTEGRLFTDDVMTVDQEIESKYPRSRLKGGELLVTLVGSVGQSAIAGPELAGWNVARAVGVIPIDDPVLVKWVNYVIRSDPAQQYFLQRANTTVQTTLNLGDLAVLPIPMPSRSEIAAIVSFLSALDDKIELNRRTNETLEAQARALFRDWFVDFGPVKAKAKAKASAPNAPTPYLAPDLWSLFPDRIGDDGVPEGWTDAPLTEHFSIIGGGTPKTTVPAYWDGQIPWFSVVDTPSSSNVFVTETQKNVTVEGVANSSAKIIRGGTTIISARGTVGNLAMAGQRMTFNQSCYALQGVGDASDAFVYLAAQHMVDRLKSMAHGSVFSTITRDTFKSLKLAKPCGPAHEAFEDIASAFFQKMKQNVIENQTLARTRDLLLPKLMSGQVRVGEVEKKLNKVL
ncbi:restriction endonuclease subunit S [Altererythrobacter confluentis]|uniref:Restriction endonuclease subunit S n=1 Tax=Allopontixanthobacter confluentis TaxID=1849021 RepID=A0A6L7GIJ5_9SPHN|nr:restriction endonuclease subunit S [Allopontixanthobacter confluentis]MXP14511.1 restriction endonuclease subunit S [Allopontixanthobacter confluentis]